MAKDASNPKPRLLLSLAIAVVILIPQVVIHAYAQTVVNPNLQQFQVFAPKVAITADRAVLPIPNLKSASDIALTITITDPNLTDPNLSPTPNKSNSKLEVSVMRSDGSLLQATIDGLTTGAPQTLDAKTFTQTGSSTGVFTGTYHLTGKGSATVQDMNHAKLNFTYTAASQLKVSTSVILSSFDANVSIDKAVVRNGDTIIITIVDGDGNMDPNAKDMLQFTVAGKSPDNLIAPVSANETGPNTGVFVARLVVGKDFAIYDVSTHLFSTIVQAKYVDLLASDLSTQDRILEVPISLNSGTLDINTGQANLNSKIIIQVIDNDLNVDPAGVDIVPSEGQDYLQITSDRQNANILTTAAGYETGSNTGIFETDLQLLPFINGTNTPQQMFSVDGNQVAAYVLPCDLISIKYVDQQNSAGQKVTLAKVFQVDPCVPITVAASPPTITVPASPMTVTTGNSDGIAVTYSVTAIDFKGVSIPVTCNPASGTVFPITTTTVTCSATDSGGRTTTKTFQVVVTLINSPTISIEQVSDSNPHWDIDPVFVSGGSTNAPTSFVVSVDWGDGSAPSSNVQLQPGGKWGPITHTYDSLSLKTNPNHIRATLVDPLTGTVKALDIGNFDIQVRKHPTTTLLSPLASSNIPWGNTLTVTGRLADGLGNNAALSGKQIEFSGSGIGTGTRIVLPTSTNSTGIFSSSGTVPKDPTSSNLTVQAHFAGDDLYERSDSSIQNYISAKHQTLIKLSQDSNHDNLINVMLRDVETGKPIPDMNIHIDGTEIAATMDATTNGTGTASFSNVITGNNSSTSKLEARFAGSDYYLPANASLIVGNPPIVIRTDKDSYNPGDVALVSGSVRQVTLSKLQVSLVAQNGNVVDSFSIDVGLRPVHSNTGSSILTYISASQGSMVKLTNDDDGIIMRVQTRLGEGIFSHSYVIPKELPPGTYRFLASYDGISAATSFFSIVSPAVVTANVDKLQIQSGEPIIVNGEVSRILTSKIVSIEVRDSNDILYKQFSAPISDDKKFSYRIPFDDVPTKQESWKIVVAYENAQPANIKMGIIKESNILKNPAVVGGIIAAAVSSAFVVLSHLLLPRPVSKPSIPPSKLHNVTLKVQLKLKEIGWVTEFEDFGAKYGHVIQNLQHGQFGSLLGSSLSGTDQKVTPLDEMIRQKAVDSLKQIALQDTVQTVEQLKQLKRFRLVIDWIKKRRESEKQTTVGIADQYDNGDSESAIKKIITNELSQVISPKLPQMIRDRIESEVKGRLQKGFGDVSLPLSPIRISVTFMLLVDGVPAKNGLLELVFELQSNLTLRGTKLHLDEIPESLEAQSLDVRMKLYYLLPMLWGMKLIRMGEDNFTVKSNVNFVLRR